MKRYAVRITKSAQNDIYQVIDYISNIYKAPLTAEKFLIGLYDATIQLLDFKTRRVVMIIEIQMRKLI